jgi:GTPase SAR1 family protein
MNIPTIHLSVRVPWHDSEWNGKVCCKPRENGSCMFLPRINERKNAEKEVTDSGMWMHELSPDSLPPCVGEKVHFLSPHPIYKKVNHPYAQNEGNNEFYGHYKETTYCYPGYSFSVIPYNWMLKDPENNMSEKAESFLLAYDAKKEPALNFKNSWIQQIDNQKLLLDTFISPIRPAHSLVFIYTKNIPFIESTDRVLIGVGHISEIGKLTEYEYDDKQKITFRSTLWERPVFHMIRPGFENGFILPYQEFFALAEKDDSIHIPDYIAYAPTFEEFSFGSEWVSNDSAIESLLILHEKLRKFQLILPNKNYDTLLQWIDNEISKIWKMRGPFPGLGSVLAGLKIPEGNLIAWELDKVIRDSEGKEVEENPWSYIEKIFEGDTTFLSPGLKVNISKTHKATWKNFSTEEKEFLELLSRMNLNNEQVETVINSKKKEQIAFLKNPYLLYELSRLQVIYFPVSTIDKALFGDISILKRFPLSKLTDITSPQDQRRIRAFAINILERSALDGNTLLTDSHLVTILEEQPVQPACNPSIRNILAIEEFLNEEVVRYFLDEEEDNYYFKLKRFDDIKKKVGGFIQKRSLRSINPAIEYDWLSLINKKFGPLEKTKPQWFQERDKRARQEKADALNILANSRVSILIGPAGTGKTTLLNILCEQPFIQNGTVLKLAPTGKARVKMGKEAMTLAQFLIQSDRYNPETGLYFINPDAESQKFDTVIVDESSMLTEEQLAALLDSLTGVERLILVGDYRQLPPIGAGRPFVDIKNWLEQENKGIAELKTLFRQYSDTNISEEEIDRLDVRLGKWFSDDIIKKEEIDIFKEIGAEKEKDWGSIKFIEWQNVRHLEELLVGVVNNEIRELLIKMGVPTFKNSKGNFDTSLGGHYIEDYDWSSYEIDSARNIENWQILSPTRTSGYGSKVLNQIIQKTFRAKTKEKAIFPGKFQKRKMNKPIGDDGIVYGEKIINTRNIRWNKPWHKIFNPKKEGEDKLFKYIANGEIGLHIGKYGQWEYNTPRPINIVFSSQPEYAYSFKESDFQEDGPIQMELAYSITVHKSQGSGFKVVLFILPNPCPVLSRELFYTALTRQEDRIVILHQGDFRDYQKFTTGEFSETGKRLTDLMVNPQLKIVNKKYYDTRYIQVSEKGEFMISKSEVIIADKLHHNSIKYAYETPLSDEKGVTIHPDFTIEDTDAGITYYWEHLGLLTKDDYRSKWARKKEWYERNNILDFKQNRLADKQLIVTRDKPDGGIDSSEIKALINELFR